MLQAGVKKNALGAQKVRSDGDELDAKATEHEEQLAQVRTNSRNFRKLN